MSDGPLLDPAFLDRLERLQISTRRRLAGRFGGEHPSPRKGTSLDFSDYRPYHPGDDFRRIDYNLYARLGILLVKLFEAEDELHLRLLVDTSASMGMWGKLDQAKRAAAALGFVSLRRRDPVSVHTFPTGRPAPRFGGPHAVLPFFDHLAGLEASGPTPFAAAALHLISRPGPPGLTVLLSDLLTTDWEQGLRRLPANGGDLVVVHILAREELEPDLIGDLDLRDTEDGARVAVSLSPSSLARFRKQAEEWREGVAAAVHRTGAVYLRLAAADDLERTLLGTWRRAGVLR